MNKLCKRITNKIIREWDRARGLDFETALTSEESGLNPVESHNSTPSGNHFLKRVLDVCSITLDDSILDLGCGKGSAMRLMRKYPFQRITGIELSDKVASIAARNFKRVGDSRCEVLCMDATQFMDYKPYSYLYFYNPFPRQVMQQVMDNLLSSLPAQRAFTIVYCNPVCHETIIETGKFVQTGDFPADWGNRIYVYQRSLSAYRQDSDL
jgi:SAM-dependent methyltransferase